MLLYPYKKYPVVSFVISIFYVFYIVTNYKFIEHGNFLISIVLLFFTIQSFMVIVIFINQFQTIEEQKEQAMSNVAESFYNELIDDIIPTIEDGSTRHKLNKVTQRMKKFIIKDDF